VVVVTATGAFFQSIAVVVLASAAVAVSRRAPPPPSAAGRPARAGAPLLHLGGRRSRTLIPCLIVNSHAILPRFALFLSIGSCPSGFFSLSFFHPVFVPGCSGSNPTSRVASPFVSDCEQNGWGTGGSVMRACEAATRDWK
jgi:hypothetical protein